MTIGKKAWLLTLLLAALFTLQLYAQFSGGSGTEADPYQVATATDLNNVRNYLSSYFIQTANIDLGVAPWNVGEGWVPIGTGSAFSGNYDGNEHYIYSLFINRPGVAYQGLFSILDNSEVTYLNLENVQIIGGDYTGSLAGIGRNWTSIYNSTITGSVQGDNLTGGFLGQLLMVSGLIDCKFIGTVTGDNSVGGCVGDSYSNDGAWNGIHTSIVQGSISGFDHVGGIIGSMGIRNVINKCVSTADISGNSFVGGLAGSGYHFNVDQCYNIGNVSGNSVIGGVVGGSNGAFSSGIHYSYSYGSVSGISESGGLLGRGGGIGVNYCYWDTQISGIDHSIGGEGRTTDEMTYPYAANTYVGWDFDTIWHSDPAMLNGGYPYLNEDWLAPTANDLDAVLLSGDSTPTINTENNYSITVKNRGSISQNDYMVKLFGSGDLELGSVAGTPIAAGEMLTFNLTWTPNSEGPATLYGKVILTGDENPYNDQTNQLQVNVLPPYTLYYSNFESAAGSEWSDTTITTSPTGRKFLGLYSNNTVNFSTNDVPTHSQITVEFDLNIISTWDGNGQYGVDYWEYSIDGETQLYTTFAIHTDYGQDQSYPDNYPANHPARTGAIENDVLGWGTGSSGDAVYHIAKTIVHTGSSLTLSFTGSNLQGVDDESWGIDNILITYSDQPIPDFSVSEHSGQLPFTVDFMDTSIPGLSTITSWAWDFDSDGSIDSDLQNPSWTYTQPGNYDISITVGDGTNTVIGIKENIIHVENTTLANGLVRYYPFDGNAEDYSGHNNNGNVNGLTIAEDRYGFEDNALRVDTDDDYITISDVEDPEMSISLWYHFEGTDGSCNSILANRRNVPGNYNHLFTSPDYNLGEHPNGWNMSSYYLQPNNWYHFVILKSNSQMRLYVNNDLVMDVTNSFSNAIAPLNIIGNVVLTGGEAAYGIFDELRVYNRLLTTVEINRLYTTNTSSNECFACFSATPTSGVRPLQVQFTDESIQGINPITSWAWDLNGDGEIESTEQNPSYIYPRPGTYTVTLTVSDGTYSNTLTKTDLINVELFQTIPTEGLVVYYPFDGNPEDGSGNGHHGTEFNGLAYDMDRLGNSNACASFDGLDDYIDVGDWQWGGSTAISFWAKWEAFNQYSRIMDWGNGTSNYNLLIANALQTNTLLFDSYTSSASSLASSSAIPLNEWCHFVCQISDNGSAQIYRNSELITTGTLNVPANIVRTSQRMGVSNWPDEGSFQGKIDDFAMYNRTLSQEEIITLYNYNSAETAYGLATPNAEDRWLVGSYQNIEWVIPESYTNITLEYSSDNGDTWTEIARSIPANQYSYNWMVPDTPSDSCKIRIKDRATPTVLYESEPFCIYLPLTDLSNGLIAYYPFNGNSNDESGNGHTTTNNGAVLTQDRFGDNDSAYYFSGLQRITSSTDGFPTGTQDRSVFGWINPTAFPSGEMHIFGYGRFNYTSQSCGLYAPNVPNRILHFYNWGNDFSTGFPILLNTWYHIGFTTTGNIVRVYVNGIQVAESVRSFNTVVPANSFVIGSNPISPSSRDFIGTIDDVAVHNRSLSPDEVQALYQNGFVEHISIINPENNASLVSSSSQDIFWYADSTISTVDIEFSGDNGATWQMLADDLPAQQYHYNWTVPDTVAATCKLRVTANIGETVVRAFSIVNNTLDAGLVAYYPLDGNAEDASGNGRHGTYQNVVPTSDRYGVLTKAMSFPERNGWIDIPDVTGHVLSASLWYQFQTDSANSNHILNPLGGNRHHIIIDPQGYIGFYNWGFLQSNYRLETGKWYHLALTVENSNYTLYVNGSLIYQSNGMYLNSDYPLAIIGHYETSGSYGGSKGVYDELRLYNRKLSSGEILSLYNQAEQISLTGHITGSNAPDTGLGGVQVTLGESLMSTDTDGNGNFSFTGVSANSQYRLRLQKEGYATQDLYISVPNYNYDLGTFTLYESANVPESVVATQVPAASTTEINWSGAARSVLFSEAAEQGRAFLNYSLYRLLAGEEQNPATWTLVSTLSELVYSDPAWYAVPFGVYKYAVANNYSNGYQGVPVFSNELQRRNYTYSENFDHGGATAPGWTVTHSGTTTHPWMPVLDSGSDYSYKVMNTNLSTANETLLSPSYNCSRYEKVSVSFWHNYVPNVNSQARFQYSVNGVTWTTLFTYTSTANSGIKTYDISSAAHHQAAVRFRWLYTATSYNTNSWTIDDFSVYGYTTIPVYLSNPYPASTQRKVNSRTVELGITYIDDDMVNASSLYYRIDANGNGIYDTEESWIAITGYANASQIVARVNAAFQTDGYNLKYEFKGADLAGNAVAYSGSSHLNGISDDFSVDIDTVVPTAVNGFSLVSPGFQSATLAWQPVTELNFASYEIYYDTSRGVSLASNKWTASQDPALANINTSSTTINILNTGVNYWFRIRALDLHGNASELSPLLMYVTADLPPVISSPVPTEQPLSAWNSERTVTIGCTFSDYYGIDPASVQYRFDRNGNGVYDTDETWQTLPARTGLAAALKAQTAAEQKQKRLDQMDEDELELYMRNRNLLQVSVPVTFETDGPELRFEFKASDVHGVGPVYTGFYKQAGIDDDWFVRIDTQNPTDIASIYIGVVNPNSIEVAWSRSSDQYFMTYEVYYATHPDVTIEDQIWDWTDDPVLAYTGGDIVVSNVIGLIDNTMYYFRVRAVDEAGNASPLSNEVNAFYGTASPPALPQNLIIQKIGDDVILSWDPVTEDTNGNPITVTGYNIYASDLPDVVPDIGYLIDASSTTSYNHIGIAPFVDKIFYIITAVVEEEVLRLGKPNDQRLRTKKQ